MPLPIAQLGQPVLRQKAVDVPIDEIRTPEFQQFLLDMLETMNDAGGIGLAAPQVFVGKRVFLAGVLPPDTADDEADEELEELEEPTDEAGDEDEGDDDEGDDDDDEEEDEARPGVEVFINPRFVAASEDRVENWEGCLSFIELQVLVSRHVAVVIDYLNARGEPSRMQLAGFRARVVQHEFDHLEGVLTIDRAATARDIVKASEMEAVLKDRDPGVTTPEP
jgi:peptide deformylase